jgi:hypothetical protein
LTKNKIDSTKIDVLKDNTNNNSDKNNKISKNLEKQKINQKDNDIDKSNFKPNDNLNLRKETCPVDNKKSENKNNTADIEICYEKKKVKPIKQANQNEEL